MSLPEPKKEALIERVKKDVVRELRRNYQDLREHEVSREDAQEIVDRGLLRGDSQWVEDKKGL